MAMRCFGRVLELGLGFAGTPRAFDLISLRDEDFAAVLCPVHFFFTAGRAAAFCLAIFSCLPDRSMGRLAQVLTFCRVGKGALAPCPPAACSPGMVGTL